MLSRDKFRDALSHWGLDLPLTPVTYPGSGAISENAMYAGEDYILKAYRDEHACRLAIALAEKLQAHHIPASAAIPLPDGRMVLPLAEGLHMTLCRRMEGQPMTAAALIRDPSQGYRIGAALAEELMKSGSHTGAAFLGKNNFGYTDKADVRADLNIAFTGEAELSD